MKSRNTALTLIDNNINISEIQQLRERATGEISLAILTIKLSQRFLKQGDRESTISLLQNFVQQYPDNPYIPTIRDLLNQTDLPVSSEEVTFGVILPLSGEYNEQAKAVLAGIE